MPAPSRALWRMANTSSMPVLSQQTPKVTKHVLHTI